MRRYASPHGRGWGNGSWRWHGRGRENKRRKNPSRMPSFPRAYGVACGRRSRHEPLRAPGRTRSGDLPLTRRMLCRLSYRGGCRKTPGRPATAPTRPSRAMGPDGGMPASRSEGRAVYAARARAMEGSNLRLRFWRPSGRRRSDGAFMFPLFGFQPCHAGRVRGGMAWYASPNGRPAERVPPAGWFRAASLRRPARLIRAALPDRATKPAGNASSHDAYHSGFYRSCRTDETGLTTNQTACRSDTVYRRKPYGLEGAAAC